MLLQENIAYSEKEYKNKIYYKSEILARRILFNESQDIRNIKNAITKAKVNQLRAQQIRQNHISNE